MDLHSKFAVSLLILIISFKNVCSINCYQCSGTNSDEPFECNEYLDSESSISPKDCDSIHGAQFCIKHVGRFEGYSISCYQCNSSSDMECGDGLMNLDKGILQPQSCDYVHNAMFCIKQIGGISTKRYCSSLDLGNYCNTVQQPGDKLDYRTCVYTCMADGCNVASTVRISSFIVMILSLLWLRFY